MAPPGGFIADGNILHLLQREKPLP